MSIFASGSEVSLAVAAQAQLKEKGVAARVVSMPCFPAFFEQPEEYRRSVIGSAKVRVGVEAAVRFGWDAIIGDGPFIGMKSFGESGPYKAVYQHFGITPEAVVRGGAYSASAPDAAARKQAGALSTRRGQVSDARPMVVRRSLAASVGGPLLRARRSGGWIRGDARRRHSSGGARRI